MNRLEHAGSASSAAPSGVLESTPIESRSNSVSQYPARLRLAHPIDETLPEGERVSAAIRAGLVLGPPVSSATACVAVGCKEHPSALVRGAAAKRAVDMPQPRPAIAGADLCVWHVDQFGKVLGDLVTLHQAIEQAVLRRSSAASGGKVDTSGVRDVGDRWNPYAAHVLAQLNDWTAFVVRVVLRDRPVPPDVMRTFEHTDTEWEPDGEKIVTKTPVTYVIESYSHGMTVDDHPRLQLAALAQHHAAWLALYPTLGPALLTDALDFRRRGIRVDDAATYRRRALPGRFCRHLEHDTELGPVYCHGQLVAVWRDDPDGPGSEILCSNDPAHRLGTKEELMAHAG